MGSVSDFRTRDTRPRLLYSWGASFLTIAEKAYHQAEHLHGPIGIIIRTIASVATPILHPMQRRWLSILSFIDRQILTIEDLAMTVFPPSSNLFSIVDELALMAESLPKYFEDAVEAFVPPAHKLPSFEHKKDATVDIECDEQEKKMMVMSKEGAGNGHEIHEMKELDVEDEKKLEGRRKRIMEEEIKEVEEITCNEIIEELEIVNDKKRGRSKKDNEEREVVEAVAILELFDEGWGGTSRGGIQ